jgi:hypothetical protein
MPRGLAREPVVNVGVLMNATALIVSIMALAASVLIGSRQVGVGRRQVQAAQRSDSTLVAVELLTQECRSETFLDSEEYVLWKLREEHSPDRGVDGLPPEARKHVTRIGLYFSSLGMMEKLGGVDHALLISATHYRVRRAWAMLEPYILVERTIRKSTYMAYFEHLAATAGDADLPELHRNLGLKKIGMHSARFAAEFPSAGPASRMRSGTDLPNRDGR